MIVPLLMRYRPGLSVYLIVLLSLSVAMLEGCSTTPVVSQTKLPPLPKSIKTPPRPFPQFPSKP